MPLQKGQSGNPKGKPKGAVSRHARAVRERVDKTGESPLEVMIEAMRKARDAGDWDNAAKYAAMAAPYVHPRLQAIEHGTKDDTPLKLQVSWLHGDNAAPELPYAPPPKVY
jgi:Family of unknown function (DUF5681)